MAVSMLHHVPDWTSALAETRRVVRPGGTVAVMAFTRERLDAHWVEAYFPTALAHFRDGHQSVADLRDALPGAREIPVRSTDTLDGSLAALGRTPDLLLDPDVRRQTSFIEWTEMNCPDELTAGIEQLESDLATGQRPEADPAVEGLRRSIGDALVFAWDSP